MRNSSQNYVRVSPGGCVVLALRGVSVVKEMFVALFVGLVGLAGVGTVRWGKAFRSCPPSACGLLLLNFAKSLPPPRHARPWHSRVQHSRGSGPGLFKRVLASSGHRGRDDARGRRLGGARGLTRTSPERASTSCRVGRRAPSARACALRAPGRERAARCPSITTRSAGRQARGSRQARCLAKVRAAGLDGPRWPVEAKTLSKVVADLTRECCLLACHARRGGAGEAFSRS